MSDAVVCLEHPSDSEYQAENSGYRMYIPKGTNFFGIDTTNSNALCVRDYFMGDDGRPVVRLTERCQEVNYEIASPVEERLYAEIQDYNEETATALLYYPDHESKRLFCGKIYKKIKEMGLLEKGKTFFINTPETENGFKFEIIPTTEEMSYETEKMLDKLI